MDIAVNFAIALEMVIVSLFVTGTCLHKKRSSARVYLFLAIFSAIVVSLGYLLMGRFSFFANGCGVFVLFCLICLCPVSVLFRESFASFLAVLSSSWVYTMLMFSLSVHAAKLFPFFDFGYLVLGIQTCLYGITIYWLLHFIKHKFLYLLHNISPKIQRYFQWVSIIWLLLIVVLNFTFSYSDSGWMRVAALLILTGNIVFSYLFLFYLLKNLGDIKQLQKAIYVDEMTGLHNRSRMFLDAAEMMKKREPFHLFYIDLNDFKSVNDSYGHMAGDDYLCKVAAATKEVIGDQGKLYRMSGDEFICLYTGGDIMCCLRKMDEYPWQQRFNDVDFLGFSVGYSKYPEDSEELDTLIHIADSNMYQQKRSASSVCEAR